jgi:hypothetical protein
MVGMCKFLTLFFSLALFGQTSSFLVASGANGPIVYQIEASQRGFDIAKMVTQLSGSGIFTGVALQTTSQLLYNVISLTPATNYTMFIVNYATTSGAVNHIVVPVEQILEVVYRPYPQKFSSNQQYAVGSVSGVLPYISVDPVERAADIQSIFNYLNTTGRSSFSPSVYKIYIQTSLDLSNYYGLTSGVIVDARSVTISSGSNGTLMLISYQYNTNTYSVVIAPEQVVSITYSTN